MKNFFEAGGDGEKAVLMRIRGYEKGVGLLIPSDLAAVDSDTDKYGEDQSLWYSKSFKRYYVLEYNPQAMEWYGFRLTAKSKISAKAEWSLAMERRDIFDY
ncbi:hypothetical protein D3C78_1352630 [compost metagenome]